MPSYEIWEILITLTIILFPLWAIIFVATGGIQKDLKRIRKMWHDADPRNNHREP